ncbi:MAG: S8 family peptidase, partial [Bacteroidales bacterium]|nr:S8 family peptidase [Bacteroidales bacterium]
YSDLDGNTTAVTNAADLAAAKGILVVNSAGNSGNDPWKYLIAPADGDSVLAVGAVDQDGIITSFSSYGFDWASKIKPNIVGQGGNTALTSIYTDEIITGNGTSYSSPLIAGMMACLWQSRPFASNMELIQAIEESASQYSNPDYQYGYGIPDFYAAQLSLAVNEKPNLENSIRIHPNPVLNYTLVQWNRNAYNALELLDIQGRILLKQQLNDLDTHYNLVLESYKSGIYFIRLSNDNQVITKKIIKI